jgi:hypothetical protein
LGFNRHLAYSGSGRGEFEAESDVPDGRESVRQPVEAMELVFWRFWRGQKGFDVIRDKMTGGDRGQSGEGLGNQLGEVEAPLELN